MTEVQPTKVRPAHESARPGDTSVSLPTVPRSAGGQLTVSYLVRFWLEPGELDSHKPPVRGYIRDLRTGKERHLGDPRLLTEHIIRHLRVLQEEQVEPDRLGGTVG